MEIVDQIRHTANIIEIAAQYTSLNRRGKKYLGLCPFHNEKTPSFTVDEDKQLFHCFGCGAGGDIFTLVMEKENLSFPEALRYLAEKYNIKLPEQKKLSPQLIKLEEKVFRLMEEALAFYRKNLLATSEGKKALEYLRKRKIGEDTIRDLKLGYALNSWDSLLSSFRGRNIQPDLLEKAGLALRRQSGDGYYDRFRGRIIFPIFNLSGKVVAFGGRTMFNEDPKYLNSPDTPVYTKGNLLYGLNFSKQPARDAQSLFLVEGYMDLIALFDNKIPNVAAVLGTSLTQNQVALGMRFAPLLKVAFDGDTAGRKAARRAVSLCFEKGVQVQVVVLPDKEDPDTFIQQNGREGFLQTADRSPSGLTYLIRTLIPAKNFRSPEEKARAAREVLQEIDRIPDAIIRSESIKQIAEYLDVDESVLRGLMKHKPSNSKRISQIRFMEGEKRLLQIILHDASIAALIFNEMKEEDIHGLPSQPIFSLLLECFRKGAAPDFHKLSEKIDKSLISWVSEVLQEEIPPTSLEEARDCLLSLRQFTMTTELKRLKTEIINLKKKGEDIKIPPILNKIMDTNKRLYEMSQRNQ